MRALKMSFDVCFVFAEIFALCAHTMYLPTTCIAGKTVSCTVYTIHAKSEYLILYCIADDRSFTTRPTILHRILTRISHTPRTISARVYVYTMIIILTGKKSRTPGHYSGTGFWVLILPQVTGVTEG